MILCSSCNGSISLFLLFVCLSGVSLAWLASDSVADDLKLLLGLQACITMLGPGAQTQGFVCAGQALPLRSHISSPAFSLLYLDLLDIGSNCTLSLHGHITGEQSTDKGA